MTKIDRDLSGETVSSQAGPPVTTHARKDVYLVGPGADTIQGGSGQDWIFGVDGNDLLTGGLDRQASDLIFGEGGDDRFQVIPDFRTPRPDGQDDYDRALTPPVANATDLDNAGADLFVGGDGNDRVVYLGADGTTGRDYVLIGYDRFLHRYKVGALVLQTDPANPANTSFVYDPASQTWLVKYSYFQANGVEGLLVDTRGGADVVHADGGKVLNTAETWGVERGDIQDRATLYAALEIRGGDGQDVISGGPGNDVLFGGNDNDYVQGGEGNDRILGENGSDRLAGATALASQVPPATLLAGTPDGTSGYPPTAFSPRSYYAYQLAEAEPARGWKYVSPNLPTSGTAGVADSFAWDGAQAGAGLSRLQALGDFNGDGASDFLATGADGQSSYILFGPLNRDQLYRVDTDPTVDPSTDPPDQRVRGTNWSYTVPTQDDTDQTAARQAFTVAGRAEVTASGQYYGTTYTPARRQGDFDHLTSFPAPVYTPPDGRTDLLLVSQFDNFGSTNVYFRTIAGASDPAAAVDPPGDFWTANVGVPLRTEAGAPVVPQAFVLKANRGTTPAGYDRYASPDVLLVGSGPPADATAPFARLFSDPRTDQPLRLDFYASGASYTSGSRFYTAVADVNHDGQDDQLFGISDYGTDHLGRVYLIPVVTGAAGGSGTYDLDSSPYIWQGFGLGPVWDLGDLNGDLTDEFAFGRAVEGGDPLKQGSVFVYAGGTGYQFGGTQSVSAESPNQLNTQFAYNAMLTLSRGLAAGEFVSGVPEVTGGDFDGDKLGDVAVGLASADGKGRVSVFKNAAYKAQPSRYYYSPFNSTRLYAAADVAITGEEAGGGFGTLSFSPGLDLDGDRVSDLVVGAGAATGHIGTDLTPDGSAGGPALTPQAGRVYALFGGRSGAPSADAEYLTNRDITGSGLYLVEQATGRPWTYQAPPSASTSGTQLFGSGELFSSDPRLAEKVTAASGTLDAAGVLTAPAAAPGVALVNTPAPLSAGYRLESDGNPAFVFDYAGPQDYKFARYYTEAGNSGYTRFVVEFGRVTAAGSEVLSTSARETFNYPIEAFSLDVVGNRVTYTYGLRFSFGPLAYSNGSYTFPANDPLNAAGGRPTRAGVSVPAGQTLTFQRLGLTELADRWYRFSTLGDGAVGDQLAVRMQTADGRGTASRPALRTEHATGFSTLANAPEGSLRAADVGLATACYSLPEGTPVATGTGEVGGPAGRFQVLTLDLSNLLGFVETPDLVESAYLAIGSATGAEYTGSLTLEVQDAEPGLTPTAADAAPGNVAGPYQRAFTVPVTANVVSVFNTQQADLTQVVRDALRRGRTHIALKLSGGPAGSPLTVRFPAAGPQPWVNRLSVTTAARGGVLVDVSNAAGGRLAVGQTVVDLRDYPAGDYFVRVYDPFQNTGRYIRPGTVAYRFEIEAPKVGEADAPPDRDEVRGGPGNDVLSGGDGFDHFYGGDGRDTVTGAVAEFPDSGAYGTADVRLNPPTGEDQTQRNAVPSEDVAVFTAAGAKADSLANQFAARLGLLVTYTGVNPLNGQPSTLYDLLRPITASDLAGLVELTLRPVPSGGGREGGTDAPPLTGLEYAVNLEYLRILQGGTDVDPAPFETGGAA